MREELYAHLLDTYEHELRTTGDEIEAQRKAIARMGEPELLTTELRSTVSMLECYERWLINKFFMRRSGERIWAMALRVATVMAVFMSISTISKCLLKFGEIVAWTPNGQITVRFMIAIAGCFSFGAFLLTFLAEVLIK